MSHDDDTREPVVIQQLTRVEREGRVVIWTTPQKKGFSHALLVIVITLLGVHQAMRDYFSRYAKNVPSSNLTQGPFIIT
jgi:hypothetical protein